MEGTFGHHTHQSRVLLCWEIHNILEEEIQALLGRMSEIRGCFLLKREKH